MRNAFAAELTKLAAEMPDLVFLSGDIGNKLFDPFKAIAPERFFNCGVAEANMISMAAGMAAAGMRPVAYTITPFITYRCIEQIRVDVCYHAKPVVIVGVGSGLGYASLGATHHSCEDIAMLRALPGLSVVCPADPWEVRQALREALRHPGPVYIRLGKKGEPAVHKEANPFAIGKAIWLSKGGDVCVLSTGTIIDVAQEVVSSLATQGIQAGLCSFHTLKPLDEETLLTAFSSYKTVVTIEEHSLIGGFGSAVAEWVVDNQHAVQPAKLLRVGTQDAFFKEAGERHYALERLGVTPQSICERAMTHLLQQTNSCAR